KRCCSRGSRVMALLRSSPLTRLGAAIFDVADLRLEPLDLAEVLPAAGVQELLERRPFEQPGSLVPRIVAERDVEQVEGVQRSRLLDVQGGAIDEHRRTTGELDQVRPDRGGWYVVELSRGFVMEPAVVFLPDGPDDPWHLAMELG